LKHLDENKKEIIFEDKNNDWLKIIENFKIEGYKLQAYFYSKDDKQHLKHGDIYLCIQNYVDKFILNTNNQVFFITDSGSAQPFTASFIDFKNKNYHFITDGKYGSIGCGLGELIGFALNRPNDLFILIAGDAATLDGSMCDYITIKEMNLKNIIVIIFCNGGIGLINEESELMTTQLLNYTNGYKYIPKWSSLMNSQLINSYVVRCKKDMIDYLQCCFDKLFKEEPSVLFCIVPIESYYSPVISIGNYFDKMIYYKVDINSSINNCRYKTIK
jgi:thiamine pyrophosphate-dependent acetolactate synthase large subunit-like protein